MDHFCRLRRALHNALKCVVQGWVLADQAQVDLSSAATRPFGPSAGGILDIRKRKLHPSADQFGTTGGSRRRSAAMMPASQRMAATNCQRSLT